MHRFNAVGLISGPLRCKKCFKGQEPTLAHSVQEGSDLFEWNAGDNGTFPSTNVTLSTPIPIAAGDEIAIIGEEQAQQLLNCKATKQKPKSV